jgi:hypothetical protein
MHNHYYWAIGVGLLAGFYLANAPTGTGIYSTMVGQTAANIYTAGFGTGSPAKK